MRIQNRFQSGFGIIELLVIVVIIAVLSLITLSSYSGSNKQKPATVKQHALTALLQSDLSNASDSLKLFFVDNNRYPVSLDSQNCTVSSDKSQFCLKTSQGIKFVYSSSDLYQTYTLTAIDTVGTKYRVTNNSEPVQVAK